MLALAWVFSLAGLVLALLVALRARKQPTSLTLATDLPPISVLVPARNEVATLHRCLASLLALDYPEDKIEILIADDHSEDGTAALIRQYATRYPQVRLVTVGEPLGHARAKANALAYLAQAATHSLWLLTDADVKVPTQWARAMVGWHQQEQAHLVAGVTTVSAETPFSHWQAVDWIAGRAWVQVAEEARVAVSVSGNNLLVTREAYEGVGGYATLPFSVTEDYALYQALRKAGYATFHAFAPEARVATLPQSTLAAWLRQRNRWAQGARKLPLWLVFLLAYQQLYYIGVLGLMVMTPLFGVTLFLVKGFIQGLWLRQQGTRVGEEVSWTNLWRYEIYSSLLSPLALLYTVIARRIIWKGRPLRNERLD